MSWEIGLVVLALKLPVVCLLGLVWWAVRAEPRSVEPAEPARVENTPLEPSAAPRARRARGPARPGPVRRAGTAPVRSVARGSVR